MTVSAFEPVTITVVSPDLYATDFDKTNPNWVVTPEYNQMFLRMVNNHMNDRLQVKGHVLLNDIYDAINVPRTSQGCVVGWISDFERKSYIEFTIEEYDAPNEGTFKITFNPDGVIYDLI